MSYADCGSLQIMRHDLQTPARGAPCAIAKPAVIA